MDDLLNHLIDHDSMFKNSKQQKLKHFFEAREMINELIDQSKLDKAKIKEELDFWFSLILKQGKDN